MTNSPAPMPARAITLTLLLLSLILLGPTCPAPADSATANPAMDAGDKLVDSFLTLLLAQGPPRNEAFDFIEQHWQPAFIPMVIEVSYLSRDPSVSQRLFRMLRDKTGRDFGFDISAWYEWIWKQKLDLPPFYADFKGALYQLIDPKFAAYFSGERTAKIQLDEVRWGGVRQDGIPPLRKPVMIPADEADYLADDNVVFGLAVNGDARAYPKRILAWHEMFVDTVGGVPVAGVYCTLCGTMILYETVVDGTNHALGTSGFLYRSNKLMYDAATQSLWSTLRGEPVIGPLADEGIRLKRRSVVTTTWAEWKSRHPETQVLSLDTGYQRDYSEGAAYAEYFATDELMFTVPERDRRLKNKAEVLGLIFAQHPDQPLAIAADYLAQHPIYQDEVGDLRFVVLTDPSGANRVYQTDDITFTSWDGHHNATDTDGTNWTLTEDALTAPDGRVLPRLPAHRAFWFGWFSAYSHTRLVR